MGLKFAGNLSFMFLEAPTIIERYQLAKSAGFKAVETGFPFGFTQKEVADAKCGANIEQILINIYTGDVTKGELGVAALPGQEETFKRHVELTIEYAQALNCKQIHVMSGKVPSPNVENDTVYKKNLLYAITKFKEADIIGLIEPINNFTVPNYYMNSFKKAVDIIQEINSPHLKLLCDIFHLQQISGNISRNIKEYLPYIGHIQIAQVPDRNEPDTAGEINYQYILSFLQQCNYDNYIGLEYLPKTASLNGLHWINKFGYTL